MAPSTCIGFKLLFACLFLSVDALACSTSAWTGGSSGAVSVNNPANGVPSVSGGCGFMVTGTGYVQDNSPDTESRFNGRFYFFPQFSGVGSTDIFVAYSGEASSELFSVEYDGSNITIDTTAAGGDTASVAISGTGWHLIEFSWISGDTGSLWIDVDATQNPANATFSSGTGAVGSARLGAPNGLSGLSGVAFFDDYVSQRSLPIGAVLSGDGNLDGIIDASDIDPIKAQFLFDTYSDGSTDCNLDGGTNSGDVNCVVEKF